MYQNVKTILEFAAVRDDGGGSGNNQNSRLARLHHQYTNNSPTLIFTSWMPFMLLNQQR